MFEIDTYDENKEYKQLAIDVVIHAIEDFREYAKILRKDQMKKGKKVAEITLHNTYLDLENVITFFQSPLSYFYCQVVNRQPEQILEQLLKEIEDLNLEPYKKLIEVGKDYE